MYPQKPNHKEFLQEGSGGGNQEVVGRCSGQGGWQEETPEDHPRVTSSPGEPSDGSEHGEAALL